MKLEENSISKVIGILSTLSLTATNVPPREIDSIFANSQFKIL